MTDFSDQLSELRKKGLMRSVASFDHSSLINFSSNDYLGLSHHPMVIKAAADALRKYGTGSRASRLLAGTFDVHEDLEAALAKFLKKEAALVFSSGYHTNTGILPVLATSQDAIFFDHLSHASLVDGVKLSSARFFSFHHNDPQHLEALLQKHRGKFERVVIVSEGIFSMDGDRSKLSDLVALAATWNALFYLDEAHSLGVIGPDGRGLAAEANILNKIDVHVGTLSKSLGSQGGFVAGSKDLIDLLISRSRSFAYTTSLAPASAAAARAALQLIPSLTLQREKIKEASITLRQALAQQGHSTGLSDSQIVPVLTGDIDATKKLSEYLLSKGFFVPSIRPPTIPVGEGRVRLSITMDTLSSGIENLVKAFDSYSRTAVTPAKARVQVTP